ncbi:MAG TPA: response regulator transcription factor [Solirubrobacteraceae bacterium]|nr:response regulator transcription factor [Solirubrobacteraceae bacterium]
MLAVNRLLLVGDRDPGARAEIAALIGDLGLTARGAASGSEVLAAVADALPALVLLSVDLPAPCAYEVLYRLRDRFGRSLPIAAVAATKGGVDRDEAAALLLGADDYFVKPLEPDRFIVRVRRMLITSTNAPSRAGLEPELQRGLTRREREVFSLLAEGHRTADIADLLCITRKTAATHIERILAKLGVHTQAQAVAVALRSRPLEGSIVAGGAPSR